jgi:hypothetical protein
MASPRAYEQKQPDTFQRFEALSNLIYLARHVKPGSEEQSHYLERAEELIKSLWPLFRGLA